MGTCGNLPVPLLSEGPVRAWIAWLKVGGVRTETCEPWSFWEALRLLDPLVSRL